MGINLRTLDLNLLRVLVALSECGSVSQTAVIVGLSQPAVSNALARLRVATGDELFVRSRTGMLPTPYASEILPGVKKHIDGLFHVLAGQSEFEPISSDRVFRLSMSGLGEMVFLPELLRETSREAPNIRFENVSIQVPDLTQNLETGKIDCAIGMIDLHARGIRSESLFKDRYVAIAGPELKRNPSSIDDLQRERFAISAPSVSYGADIARFVKQLGLDTNVSVRLANFGALAQLLTTLPLISIVPYRFALLVTKGTKIRILPVEFSQTESAARLFWHERTDQDAAHLWLRARLLGLYRATRLN